MIKVLITGHTGFVGKNLSKYLGKKGLVISNVSLREQNWLNKFDENLNAVIHLAGKAHDTANTSSPEEYFNVNRDLTILVFNKFLASDISDFFYFSSVKAIADEVEGVLTECLVGKPLTPYGKSKAEAEEYLLKATLPKGKRLFVIRPCMIHGPENKGNLNLLYKIVEKGIPWPLASFENQRSFLSINNLSYLIYEMLKKNDLKSGIYNFSDDKSLSTNDVVDIIARTTSKKTRLWKIPKVLINCLAKIGDKLKLPLNSERLKKLTENYVVSNQKIKNALGIENLPLTANEGLEITIKSFKK